MEQYLPKDTLVAEIENLKNKYKECPTRNSYEAGLKEGRLIGYKDALNVINTQEMKDPYKQCVQYPAVRDGIKAHAETYSFNIESELFNQLTKEQQKLWRKEIEQACISGGDVGYLLAKNTRYKENLDVKEDNLLTEKKTEKELAKAYINKFDKKFGNKLPNLKGKQLAEFKYFINTCEQIFYMKYFDYHATQGKLFEKLALLWAVWGKEHLTLEVKESNLNNEYTKEIYSHIDSIKDTADKMTSGNFMHNRAAIKLSVNIIAKILELIGIKSHKGD